MSGIIDPTTGRPMNSRKLTDDQILGGLAKLEQRLAYVGQNQVEQGLLMEYLILKLSTFTDDSGIPLINIDLVTEFQEFATTRMQSIREDVEKIRQSVIQKQQGINLDEPANDSRK